MTTDVRSKINAGDYDNKLEYPGRLTREEKLHLDTPAVQFKKAQLDGYNNHSIYLTNQFKADALAEVGLTGHEAAERAFAYAWEEGHSGGLGEVLTFLESIAYVITGKR